MSSSPTAAAAPSSSTPRRGCRPISSASTSPPGSVTASNMLAGVTSRGRTQPGIHRQRPGRRRAPARHHRRSTCRPRRGCDRGAVGLLVGERKCRLGGRSGLRYGLAPGPRPDFAHSPPRQHGHRPDRRSRDRRFRRRSASTSTFRSIPSRGFTHVAAAAGAGRLGPRRSSIATSTTMARAIRTNRSKRAR